MNRHFLQKNAKKWQKGHQIMQLGHQIMQVGHQIMQFWTSNNAAQLLLL